MDGEKQITGRSGKTPIFLKPISKSSDETVRVRPVQPGTPTPVSPTPVAPQSVSTTPIYRPEPMAAASPDPYSPEPAVSAINAFYTPPSAADGDKTWNVVMSFMLMICLFILGTATYFLYQSVSKPVPPGPDEVKKEAPARTTE